MREKLINDTLQFCSKDAMNIEGLDRDAIEELVDKGVIKTFEDVMSLHLDLVVAPGPYEKFKMSNISVIYDSIERAKKEAKPENILYSMCIPGVTPALAKAIIKRFHRISDMLHHRFLFDELCRIEGVSQELAYEIYVWVRTHVSCSLTEKIRMRYSSAGIEYD